MQVSARILGQDYGLTAEEMNRVLVKQGFLQGTPGNYSMTQKALQYAVEKSFHRGTGGYACYNRYWSTRTFDDSIKEALDVSADLISEVRSEIAADRAARYVVQATAGVQADTELLTKQASQKAVHEASERVTRGTGKSIAKWKKAGKIGLIVSGVLIVGYGVYKVTPHIKKWWQERNHTELEEKDAA